MAVPTEVMVQIIQLLEPLESDDRHKVISAALTMLGESPIKNVSKPNTAGAAPADSENEDYAGELPVRVKNWLKQNNLTQAELEEIFHIEGNKVEVIVPDIIGKSDKEKTLNAYILRGAAAYLSSGVPDFDDKSARGLCENFGCLNSTNHAAYLKTRGNEFKGSKDDGWTLTSPGLKQAALLVKELGKPH